jgi:hypothetical protein
MPDCDIRRDGVVSKHQGQVVLKADHMQRLDSKPVAAAVQWAERIMSKIDEGFAIR